MYDILHRALAQTKETDRQTDRQTETQRENNNEALLIVNNTDDVIRLHCQV